MDRAIVYPGAIPLETDILSTNRDAMVGLGLLALDLLGSGPVVSGFACTPTGPATLNVQVAPGRIYSLQNVDGTAYSSLAADTTHQILKQGILANQVQLACPAPGTVGFSVNYLIEVAYQDSDTTSIVLPYYNAANPSVAFSGPANSGTAQPTARQGLAVVQVKAGVAATTGTQTTPSPDSGYVGLWVITVDNGETQVLAADIALYLGTSGAVSLGGGSFPVTYVGGATAPTGTAYWRIAGPLVLLNLPQLSATSNAVTFSYSGLPAALIPGASMPVQQCAMPFATNNGVPLAGGAYASVQNGSSIITFGFQSTPSGWTASGVKSAGGVFTYALF